MCRCLSTVKGFTNAQLVARKSSRGLSTLLTYAQNEIRCSFVIVYFLLLVNGTMSIVKFMFHFGTS